MTMNCGLESRSQVSPSVSDNGHQATLWSDFMGGTGYSTPDSVVIRVQRRSCIA